ncbi:lasso RiPP family leader peptide-containing protein [Streptomyces alboniger]|uniref:Lasso RiPP family leader peptide-containing protein n=1 Tax=Streptomyces alboniger TaxID=132473 RepID=A0A5J6HUB1_STRAD|nr:lasso RiPP family leader peptide-containing protein [Streptomyces alboniger]
MAISASWGSLSKGRVFPFLLPHWLCPMHAPLRPSSASQSGAGVVMLPFSYIRWARGFDRSRYSRRGLIEFAAHILLCVSSSKGRTMMTYERPTLTKAGSFRKVTGIKDHGPKDVLGGKQLL